MDWLLPADWGSVFKLGTPLLEIFLRGSAMYLGIVIMLRLLLRREVGTVGLPDIVMIVFLADAAQNGMAGEYKTVTDGLLLVSVIIFWNVLLDRLAFRFAIVARFVHPPPVALVKNGRMMRRNMRRESVTEEELWTHLRAQGVEELSEVKSAQIEGDGEITVIKQD
jgi:uncharacterized membrane protein YcaP (DUF421 family)